MGKRMNPQRSHPAWKLALSVAGLLTLMQFACSSGATEPTAAAQRTSTIAAAPASQSTNAVSAGMVLEITAGTEARYRVREQLADLNFRSDAVGVTDAVQGSIVLSADGKVVTDQSKVTVDLTKLESDSDMRDNYIRRSTLQTTRYPSAEFVVKQIEGLPWSAPTGDVDLRIIGDLTIHGVTRETVWEATANVAQGEVTGLATTRFRFGDFGMSVPSVFVVLSVEDNIQLELDFRLQMTPAAL